MGADLGGVVGGCVDAFCVGRGCALGVVGGRRWDWLFGTHGFGDSCRIEMGDGYCTQMGNTVTVVQY